MGKRNTTKKNQKPLSNAHPRGRVPMASNRNGSPTFQTLVGERLHRSKAAHFKQSMVVGQECLQGGCRKFACTDGNEEPQRGCPRNTTAILKTRGNQGISCGTKQTYTLPPL